MSHRTILATVPIDHLARTCAILERVGEVIYTDHPQRDELLPLLHRVDAIFPNTKMMLDRDIIDAAPRLKLICTPSTGTDHIDKVYCEQKGITVLSLTHDYSLLETITSTAEHAFGLMLCVVRNMPWSFDSVRTGEWDYTKFRGRELQGRVLGIVGFGRLGRMMSRFADAFDMQVLAYDPHVTVTDAWVEQVERDALLDRSEILSLHLHLTPDTHRMIDRTWFDRMHGTYLVNTSRGCVIAEEDLLHALQSGRIRAAGLDVLCGEIEGDMGRHPLIQYARTHSNLMITPHCGGMSYDGQEKAFTFAAAKLARFFGVEADVAGQTDGLDSRA